MIQIDQNNVIYVGGFQGGTFNTKIGLFYFNSGGF